MKNLASEKVSKIVAGNYKTAQVFTAHGIDFCCNGGIPLEEACESKGADISEILKELSVIGSEAEDLKFKDMPMDELANYIVDNHHTYVRKSIPALLVYLEKIASVHGENHPELLKIARLFRQSSAGLAAHMEKEARILIHFNYELSKTGDGKVSKPHFGHIENPIALMKEEHENEGARFREIAALSDNYTPPGDACQTYHVAYRMLNDFESDLHKHIHLENNILFPKAVDSYEDLVG